MCEDYEKLLAELIAKETESTEKLHKVMEKEELGFAKFYEGLIIRENEILRDLDLAEINWEILP